MIVVDASVLLYAVGERGAATESCRRLVAAVGDGRLEATTAPHVIQEFAWLFARRRSRGAAATAARWYTTLLSPLLLLRASHVGRALRLFEQEEALDTYDALLAAGALDVGATALVSADAAFAEVEGLAVVRPGTREFERLLA